MALTRNECWSIGVWCFGAEIFPSCQEIACSLYMYIRYSYLFRLVQHKKLQPVYYDILMVHFEMYENILYLFIIWGFS